MKNEVIIYINKMCKLCCAYPKYISRHGMMRALDTCHTPEFILLLLDIEQREWFNEPPLDKYQNIWDRALTSRQQIHYAKHIGESSYFITDERALNILLYKASYEWDIKELLIKMYAKKYKIRVRFNHLLSRVFWPTPIYFEYLISFVPIKKHKQIIAAAQKMYYYNYVGYRKYYMWRRLTGEQPLTVGMKYTRAFADITVVYSKQS